jgi:hypothetical protein
MNAVSLSEVKRELTHVSPSTLQALCLRLARYKKENKELLTYLLFEAHDESAYLERVKQEMDDLFEAIPKTNVYFIKKSLRKVLRILNKQIRYSGIKQSELELRIYFCRKVSEAGIRLLPSQVLINMYQQQLKKIDSVLEKLPEDLQYDYHGDIKRLR